MITRMSRFLDMTTDPSEYATSAYPADLDSLVAAPAQKTVSRSRADRERVDPYRVFFYALLAYLYFFCSRISELTTWARFALVLLPILLIGVIVSRRSTEILQMRSGKALIAFTFWVAACIPTSLWRSDSLNVLRGTLISLFIAVAMAAFVRTVRDSFQVMYTIGLAMATVAIMGLVKRPVAGGGERLGAAGTLTLSDPNFFCLYLLVGICFLLLSVSVHRGLKRLLSLGLVILCLGSAARTGSRMGLFAFAVGVLAFFIFGTKRQRIYMVVSTLLIALVVPPLLPQTVRQRFLVLFTSTGDTTGINQGFETISPSERAAVASADIRKQLFLRSLRFTYEHPIFGVGPGQFMQAEVNLATEEKRKALWFYSHNAYTETSSETGVLGFVLFIVALFGAQVGLRRIRKYGPDLRTRRMALFLQLALIIVTVCAAFLTLGYGGIIWILIGVAGTFQLAVAREAKLTQSHLAGLDGR